LEPDALVNRASSRRAYAQNFFIIFVDGMFTTFIARLFTNAFDASRKNSAIACV
jgi:general stress protein CsbA